ncbi:MAG: hypothetical protein FH756_15010 [Firmicutes bacterium]|nr:hypothetical protein [Bacillota bacterium]
MKNQDVENKLNNAENYLYEIGQLAEQVKGKYEFSAEIGNLEKMKKLADDAKMEVADAKNKNQ